MRIKRIVFVNRAPFDNLDLDLSDKNVISLTGINGSGKTTIISHIVDAFYEIARDTFRIEFTGDREGRLYRISSSLYNSIGTQYSLAYIAFEVNGKEIHYFDFIGEIDEPGFTELMSNVWKEADKSLWPINYESIRYQLENGNYAKYCTIEENEAKNAFSNNILTYFPSYRYEQPSYLNDVFQMKLTYKMKSDMNGYLINPIEITSDLPQIANWIMDIVLDSNLYGDRRIIEILNTLVSVILISKIKNPVRIGVGQRYLGGARIQIVESKTGKMVYPTIFGLSSGEAALLCIFGELIRQADRIRKSINTVEGIVIIDEIDKHLHIILQKEIIPALIQMFPKVQFIISTHSAFVNIGLADRIKSGCSVLDLDSGGIECEPNKNDVFLEAYDAMTKENERFANLYHTLNEKVKHDTKPVVYVEGRTDEKYFTKAMEVFGYTESNISFQWIGHLDSKGQEEFTGSGSLNYGLKFIKGRNPKTLQIFLFDGDTKMLEMDEGNIVVMTMPLYKNHVVMNKGIENALELDDISMDDFYDEHVKHGDYGKVVITKEFNKMKMCNYICGLDVIHQKRIFTNLEPVIKRIVDRAEAECH